MADWLSHASFLGHLGKYGQRFTDPLAWIGGDKYTHLTSDVLPEKVNEGVSTVMQPFEKVDKTINPVRRIPIVNRAGDIIAAKPGDALAIAAGAFFGGAAALGGGGAAGGAGGGAGAGAGASLPADVSVGTTGAGGSTATAEGGAGAADSGAAGWQQWAKMGMQQQQPLQSQQPPPVDPLPVIQNPSYQEREAQLEVPQYALMQPSSRRLKTPVQASLTDIARAGATGQDQVSENGVHIGAIRALNDKISELESAARAKGYDV